jgi:hydrophobic/amphiphilic exporter-1 (mainly G- bacteria), HAE1 family
MWMTRTAINNPVFCTMVMLALTVMGAVSYTRLPVDIMPEVNLPFAVVYVGYPGASPEAVENDLTRPIENALNPISGVKSLRSRSREGSALVIIEFDIDTSIDRAVQDMRDKLSQIRQNFPRDAKEPYISKALADGDQATVSIGLTATDMPLAQLTRLVEDVVVKRLENVRSVGTITVSGQARREVLVELDMPKMRAYGVGIEQISNALKTDNLDLPSGQLQRGSEERNLRVQGRYQTVEEFGELVVARRPVAGSNQVATVKLKQVASVREGLAERTSYARINGQAAIGIDILKVRGSNTVEVGEGVIKAVNELQKVLPATVKMEVLSDQAKVVQRSVKGVIKTIIEGALLTVLIVFLFLRSWRSTIITGLTLPISVIATFTSLYAMGFTINSLTLMALSLCIGLLIDDAIVVRENIVRHVNLGRNHRDASLFATEEIGLAVLATTFAIVAVFAPIGFMGGIIGLFFHQFGLTVVIAVLLSLIISFTLDPMLSSVWPDKPSKWLEWPGIRHLLNGFEHLIDAIHRLYDTALKWALAHRLIVMLIALLSFVGAIFLIPLIGSEFQSKTDRGEFSLKIETAVGSSLGFTEGKIAQIETTLKTLPEVSRLYSRVGTNNGKNTGFVNVTLLPRLERKRTQTEIEVAARALVSQIAGVQSSVGWEKPINVSILGPDESQVKAVAQDIMRRMASINGIVDLESSDKAAVPAYVVKPNRAAANDLGVLVSSIGTAARVMVAGDAVATWLTPSGDSIDVRLRLPESERQNITQLLDMPLAAGSNADGSTKLVALKQVASIEESTSPKVLERLSLQRQITVSASAQGRSMGEVSDEVRKMADAMSLPPGMRFEWAGQAQIMKDSFGYAVLALGLSVMFIYFVLGSQFKSFIQPIAIMMSLPLSLIGVLLALLFTGSTLNILSIIGVIMLMGLVTKNAILLVDFANQSRAEGKSIREALLEAGQIRLRPILMTTAAMVFGMIPLALAREEGADGSMGRAIIGGVITSTLLTLIVVPVAYSLLEGMKNRWRNRKNPALTLK